MSELNKLSNEQLLAKYNELAKAKNKPALASWKQSKQGLIARIELLQDDSKPKTVAPAPEPKSTGDGLSDTPSTAAAPVEQQPEAKAQAKAKSKPATKEDDMSAKKATAKKATAKKATAKKATKPAASGTRGQIGAFIAERIDAGDDNKTILEKVQKKFPDARTSYGSIASTRSRHGK